MWPREITTATATATTARVRDGSYRQLMPTHGFESVYREGVLYVRFNPERAIDGSVLAFRDELRRRPQALPSTTWAASSSGRPSHR